MLASASFASTAAMAATAANTPQAIDLSGGSAVFGDTFTSGNIGDTFADRFTFSVGSPASNLNAISSSFGGVALTGLALYTDAGTLLPTTGSWLQNDNFNVWTLTTNQLNAGNYYLQVNGNLTTDRPASFSGTVSLAAPVPEPETYGMMLAGLGVLGYLARRRKAAGQG